MNSSVVWIAQASMPRIDSLLGKARAAGLLPLRVDSPEIALRLLTQFQAGMIVYHAPIENGAGDCERLVARCPAVVAVISDARYAQIYLSVGCAAVVADRIPGTALIDLLRQVAAGKRSLVWPETAAGALPESAAG